MGTTAGPERRAQHKWLSAFTALLRQAGELLKTHWLFRGDPAARAQSLLLSAVSRVPGTELVYRAPGDFNAQQRWGRPGLGGSGSN